MKSEIPDVDKERWRLLEELAFIVDEAFNSAPYLDPDRMRSVTELAKQWLALDAEPETFTISAEVAADLECLIHIAIGVWMNEECSPEYSALVDRLKDLPTLWFPEPDA